MARNTTKQFSILVMPDAGVDRADLARLLGEQATVLTPDSPETAAVLLAEGDVDWVVTDPASFLVAPETTPAHVAASILEHVAHGNAIVDRDGDLVWANPRMLDFPDSVREQVSALCVDAFVWATGGDADRPSIRQGRRFSIASEGLTYDVHVTPVTDLNHKVTQVAAVVWDATRMRLLQEKIDAIDKAAEELVSLDIELIDRLDTQQRLDLLEQKVIRYTRELMHFDNFTVHLLDKRTNKLDLVLSSGMPESVQEIPIYAQPQGNGICGYVAHHGRSYICPDVSQDDRYIVGIEGARSCLAVPLRLHDKVIGVFNVESKRVAAFTEDDRQFAQIFARHIAMALHILNLLVSERHKTTGQLAGDVAAEITGPLNDIITEVSSLLEDYLGHDELRCRLNQVSDNAVQIRDSLRQVTSRERGLIDRHRSSTAAVRHDPVLKGRKILVVDDEEVIRDTVCDVLRSCGCETESAADGSEGIDCIAKTEFDLVISDIKMPTQNGYEVFAAAKERNKDCPVILMTGFGYDPNHSIVRARREGLAAVLFKPFKVEQLLGEIRTAIRSVTVD